MKPVIELKYVGTLVDELPKYATPQSAAVDLHAAIHVAVHLTPGATALIPTGIAINMSQAELEDQGMAALILPRSGLGHKQGLILGNTVGLIDADYHGELMVSAWNRGKEVIVINPMMKLAQLTFVPIIKPEFKVVTEFSNSTERGEGGFGSTGVDTTHANIVARFNKMLGTSVIMADGKNSADGEVETIALAALYFRELTTQAMVAVKTYHGDPHDDGKGCCFTIQGVELSSDAVVVKYDDGVHVHIEPQPSPVDLRDIRITRYANNGKDLICWLLTDLAESHYNHRVLLGALNNESI